jgi:hypothetical protein
MTFIEYFQNSYGVKITNSKQPLLKAIKNTKKIIEKGGKGFKLENEYVYLVPELVSPTGMTD